MIGTSHQEEPGAWAVQQFGAATMSDIRRVRRAVRIAEALATTPGGSLPQLFTTPYEVKAAYTFFRHAEATSDRLHAGHREGVQQALQQPGEWLLLEGYDHPGVEWHVAPRRAGAHRRHADEARRLSLAHDPGGAMVAGREGGGRGAATGSRGSRSV